MSFASEFREFALKGNVVDHPGLHHLPDDPADQPLKLNAMLTPATAATPEDVLLLREIRDSLKK